MLYIIYVCIFTFHIICSIVYFSRVDLLKAFNISNINECQIVFRSNIFLMIKYAQLSLM